MPKPDGPVARRSDYTVVPCPHYVALRMVARWHYSKGGSHTSVHAHALVRKDTGWPVGAAFWIPPTRPAALYAANLLGGGEESWRETLALSRLVVASGEPKNAAGILLAASTRLVQADERWRFAVTFADEWQEHRGTIYRATGWTEAGLTSPSPTWVMPDGKLVATRANTTRTKAEMEALGATVVGRHRKLRFVKLLQAA